VIVGVPEEAHISKRLFHGSIKFCLSLEPWSALAFYLEQSSDESSGARKGLVLMASSEVSM
jgi:hypothetical protein